MDVAWTQEDELLQAPNATFRTYANTEHEFQRDSRGHRSIWVWFSVQGKQQGLNPRR